MLQYSRSFRRHCRERIAHFLHPQSPIPNPPPGGTQQTATTCHWSIDSTSFVSLSCGGREGRGGGRPVVEVVLLLTSAPPRATPSSPRPQGSNTLSEGSRPHSPFCFSQLSVTVSRCHPPQEKQQQPPPPLVYSRLRSHGCTAYFLVNFFGNSPPKKQTREPSQPPKEARS